MRAVSTPLTDAVELTDVAGANGILFERDGVGLAGRGVVARLPVAEALELLRTIEHDDRVGGASLRATGTVGFLPGDPGEAIIARTTVVRAGDGRAWVTHIDDGAGGAASIEADPPPVPTTAAFTVAPLTPLETYLRAVVAARDAVRSGALDKAVIAREIEVTCASPIDIHAVLRRLRASFGSSYRYSIDGLVGASPELLVEVDGATVRSHPLAGTAPRTGDPDHDRAAAEALLASTKDQVEHRVVIDMIHDTLLPWCSYLDWEPEPSIVAVANVQHLATAMQGHLGTPRPSVVELVGALCPTPALGGHPRHAALDLIASAEGFERGRYGGAVGWIDEDGNGTWAVTIRCAEFDDDRRRARLVAGGGIVAASDPRTELAETQAKLQAMLSAIVRA